MQGLDVDDLMMEGYASLIRAAQDFDASRGARLSSYAWIVIWHDLQLLVSQQGDLISIPRSAREEIVRMWHAEVELAHQLGRPPTLLEVASKVGDSCIVHRMMISGLVPIL